jgi:hypothetical protein
VRTAMRTRGIAVAVSTMMTAAGAVVAAAPSAQATTNVWEWQFVKNPSDHTNGRLTEALVDTDTGRTTTYWSTRAGSGLDPYAYDDCHSNYGWTPDSGLTDTRTTTLKSETGPYRVTGTYANYSGSGVTGPAVALSNHLCSAGTTLRTALFIHSSYPWSTSHYSSEGCIKVESTGTPSTAGGDVKTVYNLTRQNAVGLVIVTTS